MLPRVLTRRSEQYSGWAVRGYSGVLRLGGPRGLGSTDLLRAGGASTRGYASRYLPNTYLVGWVSATRIGCEALPTLVVTTTVGPFTFGCTVERPVPSRPVPSPPRWDYPTPTPIACKSHRSKNSPPTRIRCEMRGARTTRPTPWHGAGPPAGAECALEPQPRAAGAVGPQKWLAGGSTHHVCAEYCVGRAVDDAHHVLARQRVPAPQGAHGTYRWWTADGAGGRWCEYGYQ